MRIAYVINTFEGGGAALPIPAIVEVCRQHGHEVHVAALIRRNGRAMGVMQKAGIEGVVLDGEKASSRHVLHELDGWVRSVRPTHLWTSLTRATLLGQLVGAWQDIPVVSWQHNAFLKPANLALLRLTKKLTRLWVGDSDYVTNLTGERLDLPSSQLACWPIFRTHSDIQPAPAWKPGEVIRIGSLGRLDPAKGYDTLCRALILLRAVKGLPEYQVMIAGEGHEHARLLAFCQLHGLTNVRFVGYVNDTAAFLRACHLYVQPSRGEGFCIAAHEAMNMGLPVLGGTVGEMNHSIEQGVTGWKIHPDHPQELANTLETILRHPERLAEMGRAARELVMRRFSPDAFSRAGGDILRRMTDFEP
ncbi:hypothetical protein JCM25156A_02840 [Komagataeibacter kakiaceti JCM 25156]